MGTALDSARLSPEENKEEVADVSAMQYYEPDPAVLKRVIRKIDYRLLPTLSILYLFAYLDRSAIANASIFGYKKDLHITPTQYTLISSIFFVPYSLLEIPANIVVTYVRPSYWIAALCLAWGVTMTLSGLVHNFSGAMAARFFLGVTEAGFFPAAVTLVGDWYPRQQLQSRISAFYVVGVFSGAFSGLIAYGIHHMDGAGGLASWRWIFILEGIATVCLVPLLFLVLPNYPSTTKWLTATEKDAIIASRAAQGNTGHQQHFQREYLVVTLKHWKTYMITWIYGSINVILFGFSYTLPTILTQLGYKAETAQLMTVPLYGAACVVTFLTSLISDRIGKRAPIIIAGLVVSLIGLCMLFALPKDQKPVARYIGCLLVLVGGYPAIPGTLAWNSNNCESGGVRNLSVAFQLCFGNLASVIGINAYMGKEAPYYWAGFGVAIGAASSAILVSIALCFLLHRENKKLDAKALEGVDTDFRYTL